MEAIILNTEFEFIAVVDVYKSFIWAERFDEAGDFEIYIPITDAPPYFIQKNYYVLTKKSKTLMTIDTISIESAEEGGAFYTVSGKCIKNLLSRRIVWNKTIFATEENEVDNGDGTTRMEYVEQNLQNGVEKLLNENVIGLPDDNKFIAARRIPNFIFERSDDERITKLTFEAEYLGEDLYSVISTLCKENEIGFELTYHETYTKDGQDYTNAFVFKLVAGTDRSYEQTENPYVVFAPKYDNIFKTNYIDSDASFKNVTLVVGESDLDEDGNEISRVQHVEYTNNEMRSGLDRREVFTDATSLSTDDGYGGTLSPARYAAQLRQKGIDTLMECTTITAFEGEVDPSQMYEYGIDYNIGDIVQIANEYGHEGRAYISEFVMSCDESGISAYPTFKIIEKGVYEK